MGNYKFVNPYNFVPLAKGKSVAPKGDDKHTGVIEYTVMTKTPLFIPNTSNDDVYKMNKKPKDENDKDHAEGHKSYDFFTYTDLSKADGPAEDAMPVIPGSEIRGMFRSYFEILTNSCMSAIDTDEVMTKRTNEVYKCGLIKKNENGDTYDLYKAEDCLMRTDGENSLNDDWESDDEHYKRKCYIQDEIPEGTKVYFKRQERLVKTKFGGQRPIKPLALQVSTKRNDNTPYEGYIIKGEPGPEMKKDKLKQQKHCCHIFRPVNNNPIKGGKDITLVTLDKVIEAYQKVNKGAYTEYEEQLNIFKKSKNTEDYFPVYYSYISDELMLSPACITREVYDNKIKDMIRDYRPCDDKDNLCPACSLFGTINSDQNFSKPSRLRFSDLECKMSTAKECYNEEITIPPLGMPQLSNTEFYMQKPEDDAVFWTYDYYIDKKGDIHPNCGFINGRKFYWHNMNPQIKDERPSDQNKTIRPVKEGISFSGKLYFKDITKFELKQLIFLLNGGDFCQNIDDKTHGYKIGEAKPLGFGSIAVSVDDVKLRTIKKDSLIKAVERKEDKYIQDTGMDENGLFDNEILEQFTKITDFYILNGENIDYPRMNEKEFDENGEMQKGFIYEWFSNNHVRNNFNGSYDKGMMNQRKQMAFARHLSPMEPFTKTVWDQDFERGDQDFEEGGIYDAVVKGFQRNGKNVFIEVNNKEGEIYYKKIPNAKQRDLDQIFFIGQHIGVKFEGISEYKGKIHYNFNILENDKKINADSDGTKS